MAYSANVTPPVSDFYLRVVEARGLISRDPRSPSNPYVQVRLKGLKHLLDSQPQTSGIIWNNSNPIWNQDFRLQPTRTNDVIKLNVLDKGKMADDLLGTVYIPVAHYLNQGVVDQWVPLGLKGAKPCSEIHILVNYGVAAVPFTGPSVIPHSTVIPHETTIPMQTQSNIPMQTQYNVPMHTQSNIPVQSQPHTIPVPPSANIPEPLQQPVQQPLKPEVIVPPPPPQPSLFETT